MKFIIKQLINFIFKMFKPTRSLEKNDISKIQNKPILSPDKEYEILKKTYRFLKYKRTLTYEPYWAHYKYYRTYESAENALKDIRKNNGNKIDYPGYGNVEQEKLYSHIIPTITISRFKIIKRNQNIDK